MTTQQRKDKIKSLTESKNILEDMIDRTQDPETVNKLETNLFNVVRQLKNLKSGGV